jgi:hypothetical protein
MIIFPFSFFIIKKTIQNVNLIEVSSFSHLHDIYDENVNNLMLKMFCEMNWLSSNKKFN